jgi:hypothetical protein
VGFPSAIQRTVMFVLIVAGEMTFFAAIDGGLAGWRTKEG